MIKKWRTPEEAERAAKIDGVRFGFSVFGPAAWFSGTKEELEKAGAAVARDAARKPRKGAK